MSAVGRFNSQLSHLSKIPFESLPSPGETHVTSFGSEQQVQVQVCVFVCLSVSASFT